MKIFTMIVKSKGYDFDDSIYKVRSNLYALMQQLRLYADASSHEIAGDHVLSIDAQTFSVVMDHLALELENTISQIDSLNRRTSSG